MSQNNSTDGENGQDSLGDGPTNGGGIDPSGLSQIFRTFATAARALADLVREITLLSALKGVVVLLIVFMVGSTHFRAVRGDVDVWLLYVSALVGIPAFLYLLKRMLDFDIDWYLTTR